MPTCAIRISRDLYMAQFAGFGRFSCDVTQAPAGLLQVDYLSFTDMGWARADFIVDSFVLSCVCV